MYISAKHIDIKSKQDYSGFILSPYKSLLLCDGIGEFEQSGDVSKIVVDDFFTQKKSKEFDIQEFINSIQQIIKEKQIKGGTTFVNAEISDKEIKFNYLGNGGIIHLKGDFYTNPISKFPYRYAELMNPDIAPNGALNKHISYNSGTNELLLSKISTNINSITGDIYLLFTDGISTIEEHVIVEDDNKSIWRNESNAIIFILKSLHKFIKEYSEKNDFQNELVKFNDTVLNNLKAKKMLEDDASLGIIISEKVLTYYKNITN